MSYVQDKTKIEIINGLVSTARADSQIHDQRKVGVIVNSKKDIQVLIEKQNNAMRHINTSFEQLNSRIYSSKNHFKSLQIH
jgi:hypothetical protein